MSPSPAGWQPDPRGRHEYRYFDGNEWTEHVANQGVASTDAYDGPSEQTAVQPAVTPGPGSNLDMPLTGGSTPTTGATQVGGTPTPGTAARQPVSGAGARPGGYMGGSAGPGGGAQSPAPAAGAGARPGGYLGGSSTTQAKAAAQQAMTSKSPDLASVLSVVAPGSGHFYMGSSKVPLAAGLLVATAVAAVLAYMSFVLFLVGFVIWAAAAAFALTDLRGSVKGLENTALPPSIVAILMIAGGLLLVIAVFLPFYHVKVSAAGFSVSDSASGWDALEIIRFVLVGVGAGSVLAGAAALGLGPVSSGELPKWLPMAVAFGAAVATVCILFRMFVDGAPTGGGASGADFTIGRGPGILLALDAALVLLIANAAVLRSARR